MRRHAFIACVLSIFMVYLLGCGCNHKEKDQAMAQWEAFKKTEMDKIQASYVGEDVKPHDFQAKVLEEKGSLYRFKGFLSFKVANTYQEKFFAYMDGAWKPVDYRTLQDKTAMKKEKEVIDKIKKKIENIQEAIKSEKEKLEEYEEIDSKIRAQREKLAEMEKKLETLRQKK